MVLNFSKKNRGNFINDETAILYQRQLPIHMG
jgi:hypothetical protein